MEDSPAIDAARAFLRVVWDGQAPDEAELATALDALLATYHATSDACPAESDLEPPRKDWRLVYEDAGRRFPAFGYYPIADPTAAPGAAAMTGDAVDDILDISLTMREVVWRAENLGAEDAAWYFRLDYFHWGRHARELGLYLHARQFA